LDVAGDITDRNVLSSPFLATNATGKLVAGTILGTANGGTATTTALGSAAFTATSSYLPSATLFTIPWTIEYPISTEDDDIFTFPASSTIKSVYCVNKTAVDTVTFNLFYSSSRATATSSASPVFSSYQTCTATTTPTLFTSFASSTPPTGSVLRFITNAASSTQFHFDVNYTTP
jgi:hypothetical protein